jgi:Protein of unknown function (DUF2934)
MISPATAIGRDRNSMRNRALSGTSPEGPGISAQQGSDGVLREQNMNDHEQTIREQAYELWDDAGRPDGRSDEFWFAAIAGFERGEEPNLSGHVPPRAEPSRHEQ